MKKLFLVISLFFGFIGISFAGYTLSDSGTYDNDKYYYYHYIGKYHLQRYYGKLRVYDYLGNKLQEYQAVATPSNETTATSRIFVGSSYHDTFIYGRYFYGTTGYYYYALAAGYPKYLSVILFDLKGNYWTGAVKLSTFGTMEYTLAGGVPVFCDVGNTTGLSVQPNLSGGFSIVPVNCDDLNKLNYVNTEDSYYDFYKYQADFYVNQFPPSNDVSSMQNYLVVSSPEGLTVYKNNTDSYIDRGYNTGSNFELRAEPLVDSNYIRYGVINNSLTGSYLFTSGGNNGAVLDKFYVNVNNNLDYYDYWDKYTDIFSGEQFCWLDGSQSAVLLFQCMSGNVVNWYKYTLGSDDLDSGIDFGTSTSDDSGTTTSTSSATTYNITNIVNNTILDKSSLLFDISSSISQDRCGMDYIKLLPMVPGNYSDKTKIACLNGECYYGDDLFYTGNDLTYLGYWNSSDYVAKFVIQSTSIVDGQPYYFGFVKIFDYKDKKIYLADNLQNIVGFYKGVDGKFYFLTYVDFSGSNLVGGVITGDVFAYPFNETGFNDLNYPYGCANWFNAPTYQTYGLTGDCPVPFTTGSLLSTASYFASKFSFDFFGFEVNPVYNFFCSLNIMAFAISPEPLKMSFLPDLSGGKVIDGWGNTTEDKGSIKFGDVIAFVLLLYIASKLYFIILSKDD